MYTKSYIQQLRSLHNDKSRPRGFGGKIKDLGEFYNYMNKWKPRSLLDYGCGKGTILNHLQEKYPDVSITGYDPAVPEYDIPTKNADCIFSNDVLEHIEPEFITQVLYHIDSLADGYVWLRIDTKPARKFLPDGRNAHLILESEDWWHKIIDKSISGNIVYAKLTKKGKFDVAIEK